MERVRIKQIVLFIGALICLLSAFGVGEGYAVNLIRLGIAVAFFSFLI